MKWKESFATVLVLASIGDEIDVVDAGGEIRDAVVLADRRRAIASSKYESVGPIHRSECRHRAADQGVVPAAAGDYRSAPPFSTLAMAFPMIVSLPEPPVALSM